MNKLTNQKQFWFLLSGGKNVSFLTCWGAAQRLQGATQAVNLLYCRSPRKFTLKLYYNVQIFESLLFGEGWVGVTCICRDTGTCQYFWCFFELLPNFVASFLGETYLFRNHPGLGMLIWIFN